MFDVEVDAFKTIDNYGNTIQLGYDWNNAEHYEENWKVAAASTVD